jgi:hypothetical protein
MTDTSARSRLTPALLVVSVSLLALTVGSVGAGAETSEIDSFQMAVASQAEQDALAFIRAYPSSHLIGDLFDLLPPEIAQQVCTNLADSAPARAQTACENLPRAYAVVPIEPAAGPTPVDAQLTDTQAPTTQGTSISALPTDDPASSPVIVRRGGKDNDAGGSGTPAGSGAGTGSSASSSGNGGTPGNSSPGGASPSANSSGGGGSPGANGSDPSGSSSGQGGGVVGSAGDAVGGAAAAIGDAGNAVGGAVDSAGGAASGAVGAVGHAADSAVGAVGNAAGGLFGGD